METAPLWTCPVTCPRHVPARRGKHSPADTQPARRQGSRRCHKGVPFSPKADFDCRRLSFAWFLRHAYTVSHLLSEFDSYPFDAISFSSEEPPSDRQINRHKKKKEFLRNFIFLLDKAKACDILYIKDKEIQDNCELSSLVNM
jgi:hypothetical protein